LTGTQVNLIIQATQQLATVYMYEYDNATNDTVAMAVSKQHGQLRALDTACTNALSTAVLLTACL
jgi:hypothetical protein